MVCCPHFTSKIWQLLLYKTSTPYEQWMVKICCWPPSTEIYPPLDLQKKHVEIFTGVQVGGSWIFLTNHLPLLRFSHSSFSASARMCSGFIWSWPASGPIGQGETFTDLSTKQLSVCWTLWQIISFTCRKIIHIHIHIGSLLGLQQ